MRSDKASAPGGVAGAAADGAVARVEELHRAISRRVFTAVGLVGVTVRTTQDAVSAGVYAVGRLHDAATDRVTWALAGLPETRPPSAVLNLRAAGVNDLRHGFLVEEHRAGRDPEAPGQDTVEHLDGLPHAAHSRVSANLGGHERHLLGRLLGDVLVPRASAAGTGHPRRPPLRFDGMRHFAGLSHFELLDHPAVYTQVRAWLAPRRRRLLGPGAAPALLVAGPRRLFA